MEEGGEDGEWGGLRDFLLRGDERRGSRILEYDTLIYAMLMMLSYDLYQYRDQISNRLFLSNHVNSCGGRPVSKHCQH